jgi:hypothetical protein
MRTVRVHRFLTLCILSPLMRRGTSQGKLRIPILMYHSVSEGEERELGWYYRTNTPPRVFAEHMRYF